MDFPWWSWSLMIVGLLFICVCIVWPVVYSFLWSLGYTIFHIKVIGFQALSEKPFKAIYFILKIFIDGLKTFWFDWTPCSIEWGGWSWEPLFKYKRKKMDGACELLE